MQEIMNEKLLLQVQEDTDDADEAEKHPNCQHGPTVLFYRQSQRPEQGYYACSAHRDSKLCNFHMAANEWESNMLMDVSIERSYPKASGRVLNPSDTDPTKSILALAQDKVNAQYFFDEAALDFLADQCRCLGITKVVCMGAPRLHFRLRANYKSFLLDLDERFAHYLSPEEFCLYNMCNNHFFYKRQPFENFLQCSPDDRLLIVTDPPFGCRTELIAHTLRALRRHHNRINQLPVTPLSIFWIFPYFSINHIRQEMPEMEMSDYRINYSNHSRYTNVGKKSRFCGSPVRLFTNVPLQLLDLPREGYKYCQKCSHHTASDNLHCDRCQKCTSKNGQTYRHCDACDLCVKPNYVHCHNCRRCTQREGHDCAFYQTKQQCWLCGLRGHIETNCGVWQTQRKRASTGCLLCGRQDHRERRCQQRGKFFKEHHFLGHTSIQCLIPVPTEPKNVSIC